MIDGKIAGKWSRTSGNDRVVVTTRFFRQINAKEQVQIKKAVIKVRRLRTKATGFEEIGLVFFVGIDCRPDR